MNYWFGFIIFAITLINTSRTEDFNDEVDVRSGKRTQLSIRNCENGNGRCMPAIKCKYLGGTVGKLCFFPFIYCCTFNVSGSLVCGSTVSDKTSYFNNPSEPKGQCSLHIKPSNRKICQIRVDFEEFILRQPRAIINSTNGYSCRDDYFSIITNSVNGVKLPLLCGNNAGQHIYIPVTVLQLNNVVLTLSFNIADRGNSTDQLIPKWKLKIKQLECSQEQQNKISGRDLEGKSILNTTDLFFWNSDILAPSGCLQYYTETNGFYESFNYNNGSGPYLGDLHYSICFARRNVECGIRHTAITFQLKYNNNATNGTERDCDTQFENQPLIEDYLFIPDGKMQIGGYASKYCDSSLNANNTITSSVPAPFYVIFKSGNQPADVMDTQLGFKIRYSIINNGC